jgi:hypothetical protein
MSGTTPPPTRDLPAGRHQFHKERLMTLIDEETRRRLSSVPRRRRWALLRPAVAVPALALLVASAAGVVVTVAGGEPAGRPAGMSPAVVQRLDQMALVAATRSTVLARPGQFVYVRSRTITTETVVTADAGGSSGEPSVRRVDAERQVWESLDGYRGWLITTDPSFPEEGVALDNPAEPYLNGPSYDLLASLPTDPDELLARIYRETKGAGAGPDQQAFVTVGDLLSESNPPAPLYAALFRVAGKIPGVFVMEGAVDAAGRHGVGLARVDDAAGVRDELIFDPADSTFLGARSVQLRDADGIKAGAVRSSSAVLTRAFADRMRQVPND